MRVRWTGPAADDLQDIVRFIRNDNPTAARKMAALIVDAVMNLRKMPYRGRPGLVPGTRELVFAPYPYVAVYEVISDSVQVLRIRHAAQDWPA